MAWHIDITARAERDFGLLYQAIDAEHTQAAALWYRRMTRAVLSPEESPKRCPAIPENPALRHLLFNRKPHVYRILFCVDEKRKRVVVLHIRHGARKALKKTEHS